MTSRIVTIARVFFGIFLLVFGFNKIFGFYDPPAMSEGAVQYLEVLSSSKTMILIAVVEILAGLSLFINRYNALMMLVLIGISINAVLFHIVLAPKSIFMALVLLLLNIFMLYQNMDRYKEILKK